MSLVCCVGLLCGQWKAWAQVHATIRILIIGNAPRLANTNIAPGPGWDGLPSSLQQCVQPQSWNTSGGWPGAGGLMETRSGSQHLWQLCSAPRVATMLSRDSEHSHNKIGSGITSFVWLKDLSTGILVLSLRLIDNNYIPRQYCQCFS